MNIKQALATNPLKSPTSTEAGFSSIKSASGLPDRQGSQNAISRSSSSTVQGRSGSSEDVEKILRDLLDETQDEEVSPQVFENTLYSQVSKSGSSFQPNSSSETKKESIAEKTPAATSFYQASSQLGLSQTDSLQESLAASRTNRLAQNAPQEDFTGSPISKERLEADRQLAFSQSSEIQRQGFEDLEGMLDQLPETKSDRFVVDHNGQLHRVKSSPASVTQDALIAQNDEATSHLIQSSESAPINPALTQLLRDVGAQPFEKDQESFDTPNLSAAIQANFGSSDQRASLQKTLDRVRGKGEERETRLQKSSSGISRLGGQMAGTDFLQMVSGFNPVSRQFETIGKEDQKQDSGFDQSFNLTPNGAIHRNPSSEPFSSVSSEVQGFVTSGAGAEDRLSTQSVLDITREIQKFNETGGGEIRVRLKPEHLGELNIRVLAQGSHVGVHFMTSSEKSRKIIESSLDALKGSLNSQHLALAQVEFSQIPQISEGNGSFQNFSQSEQDSQAGNQASSNWHNQMNQDQSGTAGRQENRSLSSSIRNGRLTSRNSIQPSASSGTSSRGMSAGRIDVMA